ncbi:MAG TPA: M50 family metallopeptidase [Syntrophomonadaceae bacterium]|nr:M50 family metallopeptidase [Syntrophomonadaceae bacterium]
MRLGKISGVVIRINWFFLLLCLICAWLGLLPQTLLVFAAVLLHELAHLGMAFMLGVKVGEIEILPFGGQERIDDFLGLEPGKEIYLALSGPIFSLSLAGILHFSNLISGTWSGTFINTNLMLGLFNSLPALPLDGGRVLRAFLAEKIGYRKATRIIARMGQGIGLVLIALGAYLNWMQWFNGINYVVVGLFLFWAAGREARLFQYAFMRFLVEKKKELTKCGFLPAQHLVSTPPTLIKDLLNTSRPNSYLVVLVVDESQRVAAVISEAELIETLLEKGPRCTLQDAHY